MTATNHRHTSPRQQIAVQAFCWNGIGIHIKTEHDRTYGEGNDRLGPMVCLRPVSDYGASKTEKSKITKAPPITYD